MNKKVLFSSIAVAVIAVVAAFFLFRSCKHEPIEVDPGFSEYISAFTAGRVSSHSVIRIEFTKEIANVKAGSDADNDLFDISPSVDGQAVWVDNRTIEYRPAKALPSDQWFTVHFALGEVMTVPDKFSDFAFNFRTMKQLFSFATDGYEPYSLTKLENNFITGTLQTADVADNEAVEKMLLARQGGRDLKVKWDHNPAARTHRYQIDSVQRGNESSIVLLSFDGDQIGVEEDTEEEVQIPALSEFYPIKAELVHGQSTYIAIRFTDPLLKSQDLSGLVTINGSSATCEIDKMVIKVYPESTITGGITVAVEAGVQNCNEKKLTQRYTFDVVIENQKPTVRLVGKGVVLPMSDSVHLTFQSVNIRAVDVKIIKIFTDNVAQFLQVNTLDGQSELRRVGRLVYKKTIWLDENAFLKPNQWGTYSIDVAEMVKKDPGAIYRVQLSFKQEYSIYPCGDETIKPNGSGMQSLTNNGDEEDAKDFDDWDRTNYYDEYEYDYDYDYNWEDRDNPCKPSYYSGSNCTVSRNLLVTNLGVIAKRGGDNTITVAVSEIISTEPVSGAEVTVLNYQQQNIGQGSTDGDGIAQIKASGKPYLLIVRSSKQTSYLRVDDETSLTLSNFDVSGEVVEKGIKGFIYGERGVWRPGDSLFITFVLNDKLKHFPTNHPVVLELNNPQGQLVKRVVKTSGVDGMYLFGINTPADAPTGDWTAYVKLGGVQFSKTIKIETVKPNRLKILLNFGSNIISSGSESAKLQVKWLHGAVARNMKAKVEATLSKGNTTFKGYDEYEFDNPSVSFENVTETQFEGTVDEAGEADISSDISLEQKAPGMLRAAIMTRVFEPGGDFSTDRQSLIYSPYDCYVGIRTPESMTGFINTDTTYQFDIATVSPTGAAMSRSNVQIDVYKLSWSWWWESGENDLADFANSSYTTHLSTKKIRTVNGKAKYPFEVSYPEWGRYLIVASDGDGHASAKVVYVDWPSWRGRANREDSKGASMLSFTADKKQYTVGEKATVTVPSSEGGHILASIETGSEVLKTWWVATEEKQTSISFEITEAMAPNCYIHLTQVQPYSQSTNDLPLRLYGVVPIKVENPASHLTPVIAMPNVLEPEKPFTVSVSEKNNKPMSYTIAIVDDGLLDLTRYKTPDPWSAFFGREALGVKTWDLYDYILGAYGGTVEQLFAIGGDQELNPGADKGKANRFKPVVKVLGPFTNTGGTDKHNITLPPYIGSVRVMVVAAKDNAYGNAEKTVPVRKPLMLLATLPRVLGPNEEVDLPLSVFAMENNIKNVSIELQTNGLLQSTDGKSKSLSTPSTGEYDMSFHLKVGSQEGVAKVKLIARSGSQTAHYEIEVQVRNPNERVSNFFDTLVPAGQTVALPFSYPGVAGSNVATIEMSSIPPINLAQRLEYLLHYPYGCVEQTTSSAFPQLHLDKFVVLSKSENEHREANIKAAIARLATMRTADGGLAYWPGDPESNEWGSNYAGHFLLEAEKLGYTLPAGMKTSWINYQKTKARNWSSSSGYYYWSRQDNMLTQAYRLYTLVLAGQTEMGAMNRLKETNDLPVIVAWQLASAYALAGQIPTAKALIQKAGMVLPESSRFSYTYGSDTRDMSLMLQTLCLINNQTEAFAWAKKIALAMSKDEWMSTQTTAYCLLSMATYVGENKSGQATVKCSYTQNGRSAINVDAKTPMAKQNLVAKTSGDDQVLVHNTNAKPLFVRVSVAGLPETGPQSPISNGLSVNVKFLDDDNRPIGVETLKQGSDFVAEVTVSNTDSRQNYTNLALRQVFPSGWEIINTRMVNEPETTSTAAAETSNGESEEGVEVESSGEEEGTETSYNSYGTQITTRLFDYQDIRDDRVHTFFNLTYGQTKTFRIRLNAAYVGRFYWPGTIVEAMYEGDINAYQPGKWVEIVK